MYNLIHKNHPNTQESNVSNMIDIHTFDYTYQSQLHEPVLLDPQQKKDWIERLMIRMNNPIAIQGAHMILQNMNHDANLDRTNQKSADDLLVLLAKFLLEKDDSLLSLLEEQLVDMVQLGQCAQGRTTRLWQLYVTLPK